MIGARWRVRFGPPAILLGTALLLTAAILVAPASALRPVAGMTSACPASAAKAARAALRDEPGQALRVRSRLLISSRGVMAGRELRTESARGQVLTLSLPVESYVGAPVGHALVYTRHDRQSGSEVHLVNTETACDTLIARPDEIVRSALLDPRAEFLYVHSVTRAGRRDAGIERHDLATGVVTSVVPALSPVPELGPIHATQLQWSFDGSALTVQSCGFARCLSRILDLAAGRLAVVDAAGQGSLIGTTNEKLITYGTCPGLPCSVMAFDIATGSSEVLAEDAHDAALVLAPDGRIMLTLSATAGTIEVSL